VTQLLDLLGHTEIMAADVRRYLRTAPVGVASETGG
jgi:hypothetical protein